MNISKDPVRMIEPWYPAFKDAVAHGWRNAIAAQVLLGERKKVERANDVKGAVRNALRVVCDGAEGFLSMREAAECTDFDYVVVSMVDRQVAVRWGRKPDEDPIRRNNTHNTRQVQGQAMLIDGLEMSVSEMPLFTLAYTVENDFTLSGVTQATLGRLLLCREWYDCTEVISEIARFGDEGVHADERFVLGRLKTRSEEERQLRQLARRIARSA